MCLVPVGPQTGSLEEYSSDCHGEATEPHPESLLQPAEVEGDGEGRGWKNTGNREFTTVQEHVLNISPGRKGGCVPFYSYVLLIKVFN